MDKDLYKNVKLKRDKKKNRELDKENAYYSKNNNALDFLTSFSTNAKIEDYFSEDDEYGTIKNYKGSLKVEKVQKNIIVQNEKGIHDCLKFIKSNNKNSEYRIYSFDDMGISRETGVIISKLIQMKYENNWKSNKITMNLLDLVEELGFDRRNPRHKKKVEDIIEQSMFISVAWDTKKNKGGCSIIDGWYLDKETNELELYLGSLFTDILEGKKLSVEYVPKALSDLKFKRNDKYSKIIGYHISWMMKNQKKYIVDITGYGILKLIENNNINVSEINNNCNFQRLIKDIRESLRVLEENVYNISVDNEKWKDSPVSLEDFRGIKFTFKLRI